MPIKSGSDYLETLNTYDLIIGTTDAIALGLAHFKLQRRLRPDIIYFSMGLAGALSRLKNHDELDYEKFKTHFSSNVYLYNFLCSTKSVHG